MNLGDFHESIRKEINRGNTRNTEIKQSVIEAFALIEKRYDFEYMRQREWIEVKDGTLQLGGLILAATLGNPSVFVDTAFVSDALNGMQLRVRPQKSNQEQHLIADSSSALGVNLITLDAADTMDSTIVAADLAAFEVRWGYKEVSYSANIKSVEFWRFVLDTGKFHYLKKFGENKQPDWNLNQLPISYSLDRPNTRLIMDAYPDKDYDTELEYFAYTSVPDDPAFGTSTWTNWLLTNASEVLRSQTMLLLQPKVRGLTFKQNYMDLLPDQLNALYKQEDDARESNMEDDEQMRFI